MHSHWSLVAFTLMVQSGIGNVWCMQLWLLFDGCRMDSPCLKYQVVATLGLVSVGLAAAMGHLGKPAASINVARNMKRSWLSRESVMVNLFAATLVLMAALAFINSEYLTQWVMLAASLTGGMALFAMTRVYLLRTVPAWNHAGTPLAFLGSTLLLGAVLFAVLLKMTALTDSFPPDPQHLSISQYIAFAVMSVGLILKTLAAGMDFSSKPAHSVSLMKKQPVMQTVGFFLLWAASMLPACQSAYPLVLFPLAAFFLVAGEVFHRIQFYNNYQRVGL